MEVERPERIEFRDWRGDSRTADAREQRAIMLHQAFEHVPGEVEAIEAGVALLEPCDDPQRLGVMVETAVRRHRGREGILAGMAEGRVPEVMGERQRLGEIV